MATDIDICNLALSHIAVGANRSTGLVISSIDPPDGSVEAQYCSIFYPIARDAMLANGHLWSFAARRSSLTSVSNPSTQWAYAYQIPNQCLLPVSVLLPEGRDDLPQPFTIETLPSGEVVLYTNVENAVLRYVARILDTTKFSPLFIVALSWLLAHYLAGPLTKKPSVVENTLKVADKYAKEAMAVDGSAQRDTLYDDFTPSQIAARRY